MLSTPVVVGVGGVVPALYLAQAGCHFGLVQLEVLSYACAFEEMEGHH